MRQLTARIHTFGLQSVFAEFISSAAGTGELLQNAKAKQFLTSVSNSLLNGVYNFKLLASREGLKRVSSTRRRRRALALASDVRYKFQSGQLHKLKRMLQPTNDYLNEFSAARIFF